MSNIRVTYSGLIGFFVSVISVITGIVFTIIVTRQLPPEEVGIWAIMGTMIAYFLIIEPIINFYFEFFCRSHKKSLLMDPI